MRKIIVLLITVSMLLALFGCEKGLPASVVESTTEPASVSLNTKEILLSALIPGVTTKGDNYPREIMQRFQIESPTEGHNVWKVYCADGETVYVSWRLIIDEDGGYNEIVQSVSDTFAIPIHEKEEFDQISIGMSEIDVFNILGEQGYDWLLSSKIVRDFYCSDGTTVTITLDNLNFSESFTVTSIKFNEPTEGGHADRSEPLGDYLVFPEDELVTFVEQIKRRSNYEDLPSIYKENYELTVVEKNEIVTLSYRLSDGSCMKLELRNVSYNKNADISKYRLINISICGITLGHNEEHFISPC